MKDIKVTIDRFEGEFAAAEVGFGRIINLPKKSLPPNIKEGDVLNVTISEDGSVISAKHDLAATQERSVRIHALMQKVFNREN